MKNGKNLIFLYTTLILLFGYRQLHSQERIDSISLAPLLSLVEQYERPISEINLDTVNFNATQLESRHISYIYNFAINSALHKYDSFRWNLKSRHPGKIISDQPNILIIQDILPAYAGDLKLFIPTDSNQFVLLQSSQKEALRNGLISQFNLEYLPKFDTQLEKYFPSVMDAIHDNKEADFAISFSDLYEKDDFIYLFIGITFYGDSHYGLLSGAHIFEFEWCDNIQIYYPRRVSAPTFRSGKLGGTIDIPSLKCY
ncbi:MAG: hypothetical protein EA362_12935 [Saprospirales bacterium]|nr:MAG: hypothetical protein EA362_12935 [Saprospirales bacterium]